jgi:hypothetical protein
MKIPYTGSMRSRPLAAVVLAALALVPGGIAFAQTSTLDRACFLVADFLESYDKLPTEGSAEFLIKTFGRGSYKRVLERWYQGIATGTLPTFELDASYEGLVRTIRKDAPDLEAPFRRAAGELTGLSYRNFDLYLDAASRGGAFTAVGGIDARLLDEILATEHYAVQFDEMVNRERAAKAEIWAVLDDPRLRSNVPFYRFVFERVNRMRERVLARHEAVRNKRKSLVRAE